MSTESLSCGIKLMASTCRCMHLLLWLFEYTRFYLFTTEQSEEFVFFCEMSGIMFFLAAACTIRRTQLKLNSVHTVQQWLLSVISPVVWLMGIKLCRTLLTNKVKSNKSRKKNATSWKLKSWPLCTIYSLRKGIFPPTPLKQPLGRWPVCSGLCFLSSWSQE